MFDEVLTPYSLLFSLIIRTYRNKSQFYLLADVYRVASQVLFSNGLRGLGYNFLEDVPNGTTPTRVAELGAENFVFLLLLVGAANYLPKRWTEREYHLRQLKKMGHVASFNVPASLLQDTEVVRRWKLTY